jgi:HAD superfamily hydrolase (TIGR01490 family)
MIAAFFDFDGTLYTGHIWQDLARYLRNARRHRFWLAVYIARNMIPWPLYKLGIVSQTALYGAWGETMGWLLRGWTVAEGQALFEQLTDEQIVPNLRPDVLALLDQHQAEGHLVALVSGTFAPWLEIVAQRLNVPHAIGTPLQVRDGHYTGRIVKPLCQGPGKPRRIQAYLREHGLEVDWPASFAYGDSGTDLLLMQQAGHPVAVYPDGALLAHAQSEGWAVLKEKEALWDFHGQSIGLPNLLGVWRKEPEQVRESDTSTMQTPRDPKRNEA